MTDQSKHWLDNLTFNKVDLEAQQKGGQQNGNFNIGKLITRADPLSSKAKWREGEVWTRFRVLRIKAVWIKPGTDNMSTAEQHQ